MRKKETKNKFIQFYVWTNSLLHDSCSRESENISAIVPPSGQIPSSAGPLSQKNTKGYILSSFLHTTALLKYEYRGTT